MSYNPYYLGGWQSGEVGGTPITPEALNNMEAGIENALPKDGTDAMEADLNMGGNKITGLGTPTDDADAATKAYADKMLPKAGGTMTGMVQFKPEDGKSVITTEVYRNLPSSNPTASYKTRNVIAATGAAMQFFKGAVGEEPSSEVNRLTLTETDTQLMKPLTIASGGTGATSAEDALAKLGAMPNIKKSLSNCSEDDIVEAGGYAISAANASNVTGGAPEIAGTSRTLYVFNADTTNTRVLQLECRAASSVNHSSYTDDLFYRIITNYTTKVVQPWRRIGDANYTVDTSVSGLTLVKSNNIVHAYSPSGYIYVVDTVIPVGYRPKNLVETHGKAILADYTGYYGRIRVSTTGEITANWASKWDKPTWVLFNASWQV